MSTPQYTFANVAAAQTDSVLIAAVNAQVPIRVLGVMVMAGGTATNVTFNSKGSGAGTAISCLHACAANGGVNYPISPSTPQESMNSGWFQTIAGQALTVTTGAGSTVGIQIVWEPGVPFWKAP